MPRPPIEIVREELSRNPREYEYLDLGDPSDWSEADKQEAVAELLDAANRGDARAVSALWGLMPREWLRSAFEKLLMAAPPLVRVEAAGALAKLTRTVMEKGLDPVVDQLDESGLRRAFDVMLAAGADSFLWRVVHDSKDENARGVAIDRLWTRAGLHLFPQVWWSGLGLLQTELMVPLPSFRAPRLAEFEQLARNVLIQYPPLQGTLPPALVTAMRDAEGAPGPIDDALLAPLSDDEKRALAAHAAKWARTQFSPRAVAYVARLGGATHRDLYEWAAAQPNPALAQAGKDALAQA